MTVNPGFGGQRFIESVVPKIAKIREMVRQRAVDVEIEVDGGIDATTAPRVVRAGAEILVAGSSVFRQGQPADAIRTIRSSATSYVV
jgi:ribulose-phosphate 3-epimerase